MAAGWSALILLCLDKWRPIVVSSEGKILKVWSGAYIKSMQPGGGSLFWDPTSGFDFAKQLTPRYRFLASGDA